MVQASILPPKEIAPVNSTEAEFNSLFDRNMTVTRSAQGEWSPTYILAMLVLLALHLQVAGCTKRVEDTPAYKAACHGPPIHADSERRNNAFEEGYAINSTFDCIDKASYLRINEEKARLEAANTPEARAASKAEQQRLMAEQQARAAAARVAVEERQPTSPVQAIVPVDVNTGTEAELAGIPPLDSTVAAQIAEQRRLRPFSNWEDLVSRVAGLSAAQTAMYASTAGLTVNGHSLPGAPPNAEMADQLRARYQRGN